MPYDSDILKTLTAQQNTSKNIKVTPYQGGSFNAKALASNNAVDAQGNHLSSWINVPLATIGKGLDYLASFNPVQAVEKVGGMVKEVMNVGNDIMNIPGTYSKLLSAQSEVKDLGTKLSQGKISQDDYNKRMTEIDATAKGASDKYNLKTGMEAGLTVGDAAATVLPVAEGAKALYTGAKIAGKEIAEGTIKQGVKDLFTPAAKSAAEVAANEEKTGLLSKGFQVAKDVASTPVMKFATGMNENLMKSASISDVARKITPDSAQKFQPIKIMPEGLARTAAVTAGQFVSPLPYVGEAFSALSKAKNFAGTAADYQAAESAFKNFFGDALNKVEVFKTPEARATAENYFMGVMKEKGIPIDENSITKFLDDVYSPKVKDLPNISSSTKKVLQASGIEKIADLQKIDSSTLAGLLKDDSDVAKLKTSMEEMGKTDFSGMHFTTPEDQLKAMASFMYKGVHSGTWRGTPEALKAEVAKNYDEILSGVKGPEIIPKGAPKTPEATKNYLDNLTSTKSYDDEIAKLTDRQAALKEQISNPASTFSRKQLKTELADIRTKIADLNAAKDAKLSDVKLPIAPPKENKFVMKDDITAWTKKSADEQGFDTLYNQGVRDLPKGDASFLEGRKAELGQAINQLKDSKIGRMFVPQNSKAIYEKISTSLDKNLIDAFGKDASRAEDIVKKKLQKPMISFMGKDLPIYKPTERELGLGAWKEVAAEVLGKPKFSDEVLAKAKQLDKGAREAFVTSMHEAGIGTNVVDKLRANSSFFNSMYYYYTLGRFSLRPLYHFQQVPEVYMWGTARADKLEGSLIKEAAQKQIALKRTIGDFTKPSLTKGQEAVLSSALGYTEDATSSTWRQFPFAVKNEANAYGQAMIINADKALSNMPVVKDYMAAHKLTSVEDIPYLRDNFYSPLSKDADNLASIIDKYGFEGAKAHLADDTKNVLPQGKEAAVFDNAIREAMKISRSTAYQEAMPLFLFNPNRSFVEKTLHSSVMFPLSYVIKSTTRGGEYLMDGKAIRPQIAASVIKALDNFNNSDTGKYLQKNYYNLFDAAESWLPLNPSYPYSTGFLPPFSKMLYRWIENPDYYLDSKSGVDRSMQVLVPAYREMKGWQQLAQIIEGMQGSVKANMAGSSDPKDSEKVINKYISGNNASAKNTKKPVDYGKGNIDLNDRPIIKNSDGSISTVRSISIDEDGKTVLIPTVRKGLDRIMTNNEAIAWYEKTGEYLGKFNSEEEANNYAEQLHEDQATQYTQNSNNSNSVSLTIPYIAKLPDKHTVKDNRTATQKAFDKKKAIRGSLTDTPPVAAPSPLTKDTKYAPKLTIPQKQTVPAITYPKKYYTKS